MTYVLYIFSKLQQNLQSYQMASYGKVASLLLQIDKNELQPSCNWASFWSCYVIQTCLKGLSQQILWGHFWPAWIGLDEKRNLYWFLNFSVAPSIFVSHFKVLKCFIPKHLTDSWNLQDGFTNVGSGSRRIPISFLENCKQGINSSQRWIYKLSFLFERWSQIQWVFAHLSAFLQ